MPETAIGFFPDVGASSFLSRAPCGLGKLLALSGRRLRGRELLWAGLATHYVPSSHLSALEDALVSALNDSSVRVDAHGVSSDVQSLHTIDRVLTSFQENAATVAAGMLHWLPPGETVGSMLHPSGTCMATTVPENLPEDVLKEFQHFSVLLAVADKQYFKCQSVSSLLCTLESATQPQSSSHAWSCDAPNSTRGAAEAAAQQSGLVPAPASRLQELEQDACRSVLSELGSMSPMSLRLTLQLYEAAAQMSVRQVLQRDFTVCVNYTRYGWDFWRGVRSKLVEKQKKAKWMHRTVEDVPDTLLELVCREPDFCELLDLKVVDRLFDGRKSAGAARSLVPLEAPGVMLQARL